MNQLLVELSMDNDNVQNFLEYGFTNLAIEDTYYMEGASEDKKESFFTALIEKVGAFFAKVANTIKEIVTGKAFNKRYKELAEAFKANPALKGKKVTIKNYKEAQTNNKKVLKALEACKTKEQVDAVMSKYKAKKKAIVATTVTVSLAAVLTAGGFMLKKHLPKEATDIKAMGENIINKCKFGMTKAKHNAKDAVYKAVHAKGIAKNDKEIDEAKRISVAKTEKKFGGYTGDVYKAKASAVAFVLNDSAQLAAQEQREWIKNIQVKPDWTK